MTGFGKAVVEAQSKKITVEIKSLNSKQLDVNTRIPSAFRSIELELRNIIASWVERGKVDVIVNVDYNADADVPVTLSIEAMRAYKLQILEASRALKIGVPGDWWSIMLRMPDVMTSSTAGELSETDADAVRKAANMAVDALIEYRRAEGDKLMAFFARRIAGISNLLAQVPRYEVERIERVRARMTEALQQIPVANYDKGRLEQEMIFYIEKLDVNEEKQRLAQHLEYFTETMNSEVPGQGKKLGFIAQEMGREINTLGSKSNHAEMQKLVVMMKDLLEQIKEQVLNVF